MKRSNNFHRASVSIKQPKPPADAREVASWSTCQVSSWLAAHGLSELKNRFEGYNGQRLLGLKTIATDAPDFFFTEIKKDFGFKSLLDIVKFKQALDEIIWMFDLKISNIYLDSQCCVILLWYTHKTNHRTSEWIHVYSFFVQLLRQRNQIVYLFYKVF